MIIVVIGAIARLVVKLFEPGRPNLLLEFTLLLVIVGWTIFWILYNKIKRMARSIRPLIAAHFPSGDAVIHQRPLRKIYKLDAEFFHGRIAKNTPDDKRHIFRTYAIAFTSDGVQLFYVPGEGKTPIATLIESVPWSSITEVHTIIDRNNTHSLWQVRLAFSDGTIHKIGNHQFVNRFGDLALRSMLERESEEYVKHLVELSGGTQLKSERTRRPPH